MPIKKQGERVNEKAVQASTENSIDQRRDILKKTLTIGGVTVAFTTWKKPEIESVILPAHAQTTSGQRGAAVINI